MTIAERIAGLEPANRSIVLAALDQITRPMTVREIEHAVRDTGQTTRGQRRALMHALKGLQVIAITGQTA